MPTDEVDRQAMALMISRQDYGRPLVLPPGVPADRVAALRSAYMAAMGNPDLRKEAERAGLEINPVSGEELDALTREVFRTSPAAIAKLRAIVATAPFDIEYALWLGSETRPACDETRTMRPCRTTTPTASCTMAARACAASRNTS
jgi:hypothetical protein